MSVHNAMLARHPELAPPQYEGLPYIVTEADGEMKTWKVPVFGVTDGVLSCSSRRGTIRKAVDTPDITMTSLESATLACINKTMNNPSLVFEMEFEPGEIQLVNNSTVLHGRGEAELLDPRERNRLDAKASGASRWR